MTIKKSPAGDIVINIIKESDFVFETSTECTNFAIVTGVFPEALKKTNITSVH